MVGIAREGFYGKFPRISKSQLSFDAIYWKAGQSGIRWNRILEKFPKWTVKLSATFIFMGKSFLE